jgi:hypothetical protein
VQKYSKILKPPRTKDHNRLPIPKNNDVPTMMSQKWQKAGEKEEKAVKVTFFLIFSWHFKIYSLLLQPKYSFNNSQTKTLLPIE